MDTKVVKSVAPVVAKPPSPPDPEEFVTVFNKNPRFGDYVHSDYADKKNSDGKVVARSITVTYRAQAGAFAQVPRRVAELWKSQAPGVIVDPDKMGTPTTGFSAPNERVKKLEDDNKTLMDRLAVMEEMVKQLK